MPLPLRKRKGALTVSDITTEKKKLGKKTKAILIASSLLVALTICGVFISKYAKTLVTEGTVDLSTEPPALTGIPKSGDAIVQYIQKLVSGAKDNNAVSVDISTSLSVDENEITANGTDSELNIIKFAKESMLEKVTALYPSRVGTFGDGFTDYPEVAITTSDARELTLTTGITNDLGEEEETDYYYFHILLPDFDYPAKTSSPVYSTFDMAEIPDIVTAVKAKTAKMLIVKGEELTCTGFAIDGRADKFSDELDYISFTRSYIITLDVQFVGDYSAFGVTEITFPYTVTMNYDYTWAGFSFAQDKLNLHEKEKETPGISAVIAKDGTAEDYELTFTSSNEKIATVDADGNVTGVKVCAEPAVITAVFKYMGKTYTDTCQVYVTVPVARVSVSPASLSLKVGVKEKVGYVIEPDDATITSVLWFTEDESIAVIDKDGVVTGKSEGTVKVYAVTADGGFRSSCTVTVTAN